MLGPVLRLGIRGEVVRARLGELRAEAEFPEAWGVRPFMVLVGAPLDPRYELIGERSPETHVVDVGQRNG